MRNQQRWFAAIASMLLGMLALSGCTNPEPTPTSPPTSSVSALPDSAIIFEVQKTQIQDSAGIPGTVLKHYSGTGPATLHIDPLPEGQKRLGATVICSGSGEWKATFDQIEPGWASSICSMQGGASASFPLDDPTTGTTVTVDVGADVNVWVTFFSTE